MFAFQGDTGAAPGTFNSGNNYAQVLIEAFENLIIPIIQSNHPSSGSNFRTHGTHKRSDLSPEAQQLITALNRFVTALVRPRPPDASMAMVPVYPGRKPQLLQLALDKMHVYIFSTVPIRLLKFNSDGSNIRLIERDELWQQVSAVMEKNYDEDKLKADIRRIELEQVQQKANNSTNQTPAASETPETLGIQNFAFQYCRYAILSHTWLDDAHGGEVTYNNWRDGAFSENSQGYRKLVNFCQVAATDYNVTLGWMDTVCINKHSNSELDESIRSMGRWYVRSHACITYLADTITFRDMQKDVWFTRGWTLQELLGSSNVKFYNTDWQALVPGIGNDKTNDAIADVIREATGITKEELDAKKIYSIPISRRMQLATGRKVTRAEDASYSLMGIFGVSFPIAYGEGPDKAFFRLVQAILSGNTNGLLDITNWGYGEDFPRFSSIDHASWVLPRSLKHFAWRTLNNVQWPRPTTPILLTNLGLQVSVLLMPAITTESRAPQPSNAFGDYYGTIADVDVASRPSYAVGRWNYSLLDRSIYKSSAKLQTTVCFGVLNFSETSTSVQLPHQGWSFAIPLGVSPPLVRGCTSDETVFNRGLVKSAIAFQLYKSANASLTVRKSDLQRHGMGLRTLYL